MSKRIKGITIEIDGSTKGLDKALKDVNKESRNVQKELNDVNRLLKFSPKNTELLAQKQKLLADQVKVTRERLDKLKSAQEQVTKAFEKGEISEKQYRDFQKEIVETESKLKHYETQLKNVDSTQRSFAEKIAASGKTVKEFGQGMTSVGKELSMKVTAPLTAIGGLAVKLGADFRSGLSEVQAISGATAEDMMKLEESARSLGSTTKFSAKQVTEGFSYMSMSGWDVQQSLDGIDGVLNLAAASGENLGRVSDIMTNSISSFGDEAKDAGRYADVLAAAASNANTDVSGLGEAFKMVGPVAGALGYSLEDTSVALGLMANSGIQGSQAGTALRSALTNLVSPTKAMKDEMKKLGINVKDSNGEMKPLDTLLGDLRGSFGKLTDAEKASSAATIFGKEAMSGMLAVVNAGDADFNKLTKAIANSEGVAEEMSKTMQNNLAGQFTNLKSSLEELAIKISDALEPAMKGIINAVQGLVNRLNGLSKGAQPAIVAIAAIAAAIGPLAVVLGTLLTMVGSFMTVLPVLLPLLASLAPPVAILVGTLGALAAAYALTRPKAEEHFKEQVKLAEQNLELSKSYSEVLDEKEKQQAETSKLIESTKEQIEVTNDLVDTFEGLIEKSKLSTKELGQFLTLQTELEHTKSPEKIAELEEKMEKLRKKSGLSAEEFNRMLDANDQLTEKFPGAGKAVDEYGNKIADTTGKLREMTQAELDRMGLEIYNKMAEGLREVNEEIEYYQDLQEEILILQDSELEKKSQIKNEAESIVALEEERKVNNEEIARLYELQKDASADEFLKQAALIGELESQNAEIDRKISGGQKNIEAIEEALAIEKEDLGVKKEQISKIQSMIDENNNQLNLYKDMLGLQYDIVLEQGKENEAIDQAIKKRKDAISKLDEQIKKEGDSNGEKQTSIDKLEKENKQLDEVKERIGKIITSTENQNRIHDETQKALAKVENKVTDVNGEIIEGSSRAEEYNRELDRDIKKDVNVKTNKDPDTENRKWSSPITKVINFLSNNGPPMYEKGTNYHPGGQAILGDGNGPELVEHNGRTGIASFGLYDLPVGAKVYSHEDTIKRLRNGLVDGIGKGASLQQSRSGINFRGMDNKDIIKVLREQNELLMQLLQKDNNVYLDGEDLKNNVNRRNATDALTDYF